MVMTMAPAHKAHEFIPAMVEIIKKYPDGCSMNQIMSEIPDYIELTDGDKAPSPSRKGEVKYQQIVRNIVSHNNKTFLQQVEVSKMEDKKSKNIFKIKKEDPITVPTILMIEEELKVEAPDTFTAKTMKSDSTITTTSVSDSSDATFGDYDRYDAKLMEQVLNHKFNGKPKTDSTLVEYIKNIYSHQCLYTLLTNGEKKTFECENGDDYIHGHHLVPMAQWKDFFPKSLDRPSNIAPLAPYYHDMLHHGTKEAKEKILKVLYNAMNEGLMRDGIYITFEQLMMYY